MKFSILIPVYNAEQYIENCVNGVLRQQADEIEIVLVDDGSTDESGTICDRLAESFPQTVRVIHQKNQGQLAARMAAADQATGEYCLFLDADDELAEGCLLELSGLIEKYDQPDLIVYSFRYIYEDGSEKPAKKIASGERYYSDLRELREQFFSGTLLNSVCTKLIK